MTKPAIKNIGVQDVPTEKGFQPKAKKRNSIKSLTQSIHSSSIKEKSQIAFIGRVLNANGLEKKMLNTFKGMLISTYIILLGFILIEGYSYKNNGDIFKELVRKARIMDTGCWSVWAVNSFTSSLQFTRALLDGIIPDDYFAQWGEPSLSEKINSQKAFVGGTPFSYPISVDLEMRNLSIRSDLPSNFFKSKVNVDIFVASPNDAKTLTKSSHSPIEAISILLPYILTYNNLNTSQPADFADYGWLEEMMNFNMLNGLNLYTMRVSEEVNGYVMLIAQKFRSWYTLYDLVTLSVSGLASLIYFFGFALFKCRFYAKLSILLCFKVVLSKLVD